MRRVLRAMMCLTCALAATTLLGACGSATSAPVTGVAIPADRRLTPQQAHPQAPVAPATLSRIADVRPALTRIGYVNLAALAALDAPLAGAQIARLVLDEGASEPGVTAGRGTVTQVGDATVIEEDGRRVVDGGRRGAAPPTRLHRSHHQPHLEGDPERDAVVSG